MRANWLQTCVFNAISVVTTNSAGFMIIRSPMTRFVRANTSMGISDGAVAALLGLLNEWSESQSAASIAGKSFGQLKFCLGISARSFLCATELSLSADHHGMQLTDPLAAL